MDDKDKKYSLYNNYVASTILAICIVSLVSLLCLNRCQQSNKVETVQRVIVVVDSTAQSKASAPSLFKVVDSLNIAIQTYERSLDAKYKALIDKKEENDNLLSAASIIVGIIVSILGFFGFKSFQSIEEKAKRIAEENTNNYLKDNLKSKLYDVVNSEYLNKITDTTTKNIEEGVVKKIKGDLDIIEQQRKDIKEFEDDNKLSMLRLDRLEKAWEAKFNESFNKINIDKEEAETSDTEKESINPFEDTEA